MEWPRIKTIVLAILLITNIGLLSFVVQRRTRGVRCSGRPGRTPSCFCRTAGSRWTRLSFRSGWGLPPQTVKRDREQEARDRLGPAGRSRPGTVLGRGGLSVLQ